MKKFIKSLVPPIIGETKRKLSEKKSWSGVYKEWEDVPDTNPWEGKYWTLLSKQKLEAAVKTHELPITSYRSPIVLLANLIAQEKGKCSVLDWGGGTGVIYFDIRELLGSVSWNVVDSENLISMGKKVADEKIKFFGFNELGKTESPDILYINTTLQYVKYYREELENLISRSPSYVVLTRLLAGEIPDTVTMQTVFDKTTPCRFINIETIMNLFTENGYSLIFKSKEDDLSDRYDKSVPKERRIPYELNLVFKK